MKFIKAFKVSNLLKLIGSFLAIIAFFAYLPKQVFVDMDISDITYGVKDLAFITTSIFLGYIFVLIGGIMIVFDSLFEFKNKIIDLILLLTIIVILIVGIVLMSNVANFVKNSVKLDSSFNHHQAVIVENIMAGKLSTSVGPRIGIAATVMGIVFYGSGVIVQRVLKNK